MWPRSAKDGQRARMGAGNQKGGRVRPAAAQPFFDLRFADARFHRQIAEVKPAAKIPLALTDVIPAA